MVVLAIVMAAWQTAYYLAGRRIGFWSPATIDYSKVFTSLVPVVAFFTLSWFRSRACLSPTWRTRKAETIAGKTLHRIGDCAAPRLAAYAFHEGRKLALSL